MKVAILVDGEFFLRRHRACYGKTTDAAKVADDLFTLAVDHSKHDGGGRANLYRILFYDCPPLDKKVHRPVSNTAIDYARSDLYKFRTSLHRALHKKRKLAVRLGRLQSAHGAWRLKDGAQKDLMRKRRLFADLTDDDFIYDVKQKGVDMKIGLDIASLAQKRFVEKIVLIAGDADFVPAAKFARREGVDFVLDPMWQNVPDDLMQHIDGLKSFSPKPQPRGAVVVSTPETG